MVVTCSAVIRRCCATTRSPACAAQRNPTVVAFGGALDDAAERDQLGVPGRHRTGGSVPLAADEPAMRTPPLDDQVVGGCAYAGEHDIGHVDAEPIGRLFWHRGELDRAS
jgi:hypothetical protein